jgi:quercetin dioxygenase-like cupin family protein
MAEKPLIAPDRPQVLSLPAETQFAPNGIVSRAVFNAGGTRVVLFGFAEGQELTEHTATRPALVQILSGACEFALGEEWRSLRAGDLVYLPPGQPHAVKAVGPFSMLLTLLPMPTGGQH